MSEANYCRIIIAFDEPPIPDKLLLSPETRIIQGKREFVAAGATSPVERLPNSDIIKTPWDTEDYTEEPITEVEIYQILGDHPRLVKLRNWDPVQYTMVMNYMANCPLQQYVKLL